MREAAAWSRCRILFVVVLLSAVGTGGLAAHFVPFMREQPGCSPSHP